MHVHRRVPFRYVCSSYNYITAVFEMQVVYFVSFDRRKDILEDMRNVSHDSETPADGQQVFTACALIWREFDGIKKVFLPKRADTKKFLPGVYELPGGHIDFGEDLKDGLAREIMEEFGMHSFIGEIVDVFTYMNHVKKSHSIEVVYLAQFTDPIEQIYIHPEDHSTYGWFAEDELNVLFDGQKDMDDPEVVIIHKGFTKLKG